MFLHRSFIMCLFLLYAGIVYSDLPLKPEYTNEFSQKTRATTQNPNRIIEVGPGKQFLLPSDAARNAVNGDTVKIYANGNYLNDHVIWSQHNLTILGVGGRPHIQNKMLIPNGKGVWVIKGNGVKVSNVEISGARVKDKNGAAIRLEGKDFQLMDSYLHHSENGILVGNKHRDSFVTIQRCEFAFNGFGKGYTHNIYIGRIGKFILEESFTHNANKGHTVKSRARENYILYNRIFEGKASYGIDLPNGGNALVMGNIIHQGEETGNWAMFAYGAENYKYKSNVLYAVFNTFVNDRSSGNFISVKKGGKATIKNNIFSGRGRFAINDLDISGNLQGVNIAVKKESGIEVNPEFFSKIIDMGEQVKDENGMVLNPNKQYEGERLISRTILGKRPDIGAFEYHPAIVGIFN